MEEKAVDEKRWRELASEYIENALPAETAAAVRAYLETHPQARAEEAQLRGLMRDMNALPEVDPPLFFADNVMAAIQGQQERRRSWWQSLPGIGRTAVGTVLAGGALAAVAWTLLVPRGPSDPVQQADIRPRVPGAAVAPETAAGPARLGVTWSLRAVPDGEPALDVKLVLENADRGSARIALPGDTNLYRFMLQRGAAQTFVIPLSAARGAPTLEARIVWSADAATHTKQLFVPVPHTDAVPAARQSFGLRELPLPEAAREIAARYGQPVIVEDAPETATVAIVARDETAQATLSRNLEGMGLDVSAGAGGLVVSPKSLAVPR